jgi:hypothetical protein
MTKSIVVLTLFAALTCSLRIPNRIAPEEYGVYSDWMKFHFSKNEPINLYLRSSTVAFHPPPDAPCGEKDLHIAGVPWALINQFHALGTVEYRLDVFSQDTKLAVPWSYKMFDPQHPPPPVPTELQERGRLVEFSRVAFNRGHTEAFFFVMDTCGPRCGTDDDVYAHKESGGWVFKNVGCEGWF